MEMLLEQDSVVVLDLQELARLLSVRIVNNSKSNHRIGDFSYAYFYKNMVKKLLFAISVMAFCGCQSSKDDSQKVCTTIHVETETMAERVKLSEIASGSLIVLPTSDSLLLNEINRIYMKDNFVYLADPSSLYKFSESGESLGHISCQGNGPEEYNNISDFQIDGDQAWIMSRNNKKIGRYSWNNRQTACIDKNLWMENIYLSGDTMYVYTGNDMGNDNSFQIHSFAIASYENMNGLHMIDKNKAEYLFIKSKNIFHQSEEGCYFNQLFNDTVYCLTSKECKPEFVMDFEGKNIPSSFFAKKYENIMDFFQNLHKENRFAYGIDCFMNTDKGYWVGYFYQGQYRLSFISKSADRRQLCFGTILVDQLHNYPVNLSDMTVYVQDGNRIVIPLLPSEIMEFARTNLSEDEQKDVADKIHYKDDQNPVLLVINFQ